MPKFQFLLLDAGVIIYAYKIGIWDLLVEKCTITVSMTIVEEVRYWEDGHGTQHPIDLRAMIENGQIKLVEVPLAIAEAFRNKFDPTYFDRMDPGETELLVYLVQSNDRWLITTGDQFCYKALAQLGHAESGISLEEILRAVGLSRNVERQYTEEFRKKCTREGQQDNIWGMGLNN
jgi:hypothetical protein